MKARHRFLPAAALVAMPLILYTPILFGGKVLYWGVYLLQFYPWRQLAVEQIRAGHWPLWNPYLGGGTPLAANLQTAAFYPLNALFLFLPVERAFGWELALHVALAGLSAYYLGRTLGLSRFGALVSGLAYGGGGYVVAHWVFPSMVYAAAWLPLMLALTERLVGPPRGSAQLSAPRTWRGKSIGSWVRDAALLAATVALQLLAGHAQTSFYSLLLVVVFGLFRARKGGIRGESTLRAGRLSWSAAGYVLRLARVALGVIWGFALAAIQLLPSAELAAHSQRAGTLSDLRFAFELSFWPWRLISLLAPDFYGNPARGEYWAYGTYWEEAAFVGIIPILLGLLAMAGWWRKRKEVGGEPLALAPFLALLSSLSLVLAMGDHTPLYPLLYRYVPGFGLFQAPARLLIGYAVGIALLAGIGADTVRLTGRTRSLLRILILAGLGAAIAGGAARLVLPAIHPSFAGSMVRLGLTLALAASVLLLHGGRLRGKRWKAVVVAVVAADLLAFGWGLAPGSDPNVYRAPVASAEFLRSQPSGRVFVAEPYAQETYDQYVSLSAFGPAEPAHLQTWRESLLPNLNVVHHLPGAGNYDPLTVGLYRDLWDHLARQGDAERSVDEIRPVLNLLGVRYVVTDQELSWPLIYEGGPRVYRNDAALPQALIVSRARVIEDAEMRLDALIEREFDARREVVLSRPPSLLQAEPMPREDAPQPAPSVRREGPDRVAVQVEMAQSGYLVLTDTLYPGWWATVDGEAAEIVPADHAWRAVHLDAGRHTVVFEYAPLSFRLGGWITAGAALLLAGTMVLGRPLRRRTA